MVPELASAVQGLYPIVDWQACQRRGVDPALLAQLVLRSGVTLFQLRAKSAPAGGLLELVDALVAPARSRDVLLVVNDRPDLASLCGAPCVHVGQDDPTPEQVRAVDARLSVGVSTHTLRQLDDALAAHPDYIAFGPVFATSSKLHPDPTVGLEALARAHARTLRASIPLVAIGGINGARIAQVRKLCDAVVVLSALFESGTSEAAIRAQLARLRELAS